VFETGGGVAQALPAEEEERCGAAAAAPPNIVSCELESPEAFAEGGRPTNIVSCEPAALEEVEGREVEPASKISAAGIFKTVWSS
jgi:hypothetical protein